MADPSGKGKKRKCYTLEFKLEAVAEAARTTGEAAAKKYGIDPKRIREWKRQKRDFETAIEAQSQSQRRVSLSGL